MSVDVTLFVVTEGSDAEVLLDSIPSIKQMLYPQVVEIAEAFGLAYKLVDVVPEKVKTCYYRKPEQAPDELVVVVRR